MASFAGGSAIALLMTTLFAFDSNDDAQRAEAPQEVLVVASDYAFLPLPVMRSGPTIFSFVNQGKVNHEVAIFRIKSTATLDQYVKAPAGPERTALIDHFVGILIAFPDRPPEGRLSVDLVKGATYVVFCNFRDKPDAPQHMVLGMYTSFTPK